MESTNLDRALSNIYTRCEHLRYAIGRLEYELAWNSTYTWPELLGQFHVISKQFDQLEEDIPDMMHYFICLPKKSSANPQDISLLLQTKKTIEMEKEEQRVLDEVKEEIHEEDRCGLNEENTYDRIKRQIDRYNEKFEEINEEIRNKTDDLIKEIREKKR